MASVLFSFLAFISFLRFTTAQVSEDQYCQDNGDCPAEMKCLPVWRPSCSQARRQCQTPPPCQDRTSEKYCNCVDECPGGIDEGICRCQDGFSDKFILFPGMLMDGFNLFSKPNLTLAQCQRLCLDTPDCINIEVRKSDGRCYLNAEIAYTSPQTFIYTGTYDFYQRRCRCPGDEDDK